VIIKCDLARRFTWAAGSHGSLEVSQQCEALFLYTMLQVSFTASELCVWPQENQKYSKQ